MIRKIKRIFFAISVISVCVTFIVGTIDLLSELDIINFDNKSSSSSGSGSSSSSTDSSDNGGIDQKDFVQYYMWDYNYVPYSFGTIGTHGCGPTAFAMVATAISGTKITPEDVVKWCGNAYIVNGGTDGAMFKAGVEHFKLRCKVEIVRDINVVYKALLSGALVISHQPGGGLFTINGHYIVLTGIENGKFIVKDPNHYNAVGKKYNERRFTSKEIDEYAGAYWIFTF